MKMKPLPYKYRSLGPYDCVASVGEEGFNEPRTFKRSNWARADKLSTRESVGRQRPYASLNPGRDETLDSWGGGVICW